MGSAEIAALEKLVNERRPVCAAVTRFCDRLFEDLTAELTALKSGNAKCERRRLGNDFESFSFEIEDVGRFTLRPVDVAALPSPDAPGPFPGIKQLTGRVVLFWAPPGAPPSELGAAIGEIYVKPQDPDLVWCAGGIGVETGPAGFTDSAAPWVLRVAPQLTFTHRPLKETTESELQGRVSARVGF
jgi:hypothetical protein